jgi:hypothetical protein
VLRIAGGQTAFCSGSFYIAGEQQPHLSMDNCDSQAHVVVAFFFCVLRDLDVRRIVLIFLSTFL